MLDSTSIGLVVQLAAQGDQLAWSGIVRAYTPLLASVCRTFGLSKADAEDIGGRVWMHLLTNIARIREPAALPGWLRTTTRRECQTMVRRRVWDAVLEEQRLAGSAAPLDTRLLAEERYALLREAIGGLADSDRRLLAMLFADPPVSYAQISRTLNIPVGAIGPTRQRILKRLRQAQVWRGDYKPTR